jgi:hypothetical protein
VEVAGVKKSGEIGTSVIGRSKKTKLTTDERGLTRIRKNNLAVNWKELQGGT